MEDLSLDNILTGSEIDNLFVDNDSQETPPEDNGENNTESEDSENNTTEVDTDDLFEMPESVGSEEKNEGKEDTTSTNAGYSPNTFSSIAKAFVEEGIFPDLDDETISKVKNAEDFRALIDERINSELSERQKRINDALGIGVPPNAIKHYEETLGFLDSINDDSIREESEKGENLRKSLIYQDFINRGYSKERATREVQKSLDGGTDVEDAVEALKGNKEYYGIQYNNLMKQAKAQQESIENERKQQVENLRKDILESKTLMDMTLDKSMRQKIFDNIMKPVYKDPETGEYYTAIQQYEKNNRMDFLKNLGIVYTLTNGFKDFDTLFRSKVQKEVKKGFKELEMVLNNQASSGGKLNLANGFSDPDSYISRDWKLDI